MKDLDDLSDQLQPDQLQPDELKLPKWGKVTINRFGEILSIVSEDKSYRLKTSKRQVGRFHAILDNDIDMPDLDSEESALQRGTQKREGRKILSPDQMINRLPISLAQLKAGNNLEKLNNEIIQLLYSLYRSKKFAKTIYNNLINTLFKNSKTNESHIFRLTLTNR